jgi:hypothetical protein
MEDQVLPMMGRLVVRDRAGHELAASSEAGAMEPR